MKQKQFDKLCKQYEDDTMHLSRTKFTHPSWIELYSDISDTIVPMLLTRVRSDVGAPWYLFELLYRHTGAKPWFDDEIISRHQATRESWIKWGEDNKYID